MEVEKRLCLSETPSINFGSPASQTSLQRSLLIIAPAISADTHKMWHIISVSANTTSSKCDPGSLPQALRHSCYVGLPPCPPFTKTARFYSVNLELFTAVEAQTETAGHLSSHPRRTHRACPKERGVTQVLQQPCQECHQASCCPLKPCPSLPLHSQDLLKTTLSVLSEH